MRCFGFGLLAELLPHACARQSVQVACSEILCLSYTASSACGAVEIYVRAPAWLSRIGFQLLTSKRKVYVWDQLRVLQTLTKLFAIEIHIRRIGLSLSVSHVPVITCR